MEEKKRERERAEKRVWSRLCKSAEEEREEKILRVFGRIQRLVVWVNRKD